MLKKLIGIGLAAIVALLVVLAWDRHEDAKAFNLAMDYCGPGNVKSIDTKGLFFDRNNLSQTALNILFKTF